MYIAILASQALSQLGSSIASCLQRLQQPGLEPTGTDDAARQVAASDIHLLPQSLPERRLARIAALDETSYAVKIPAGGAIDSALDAEPSEPMQRPLVLVRVLVIAASLIAAIAHLLSSSTEGDSPEAQVVTAAAAAPAPDVAPSARLATVTPERRAN